MNILLINLTRFGDLLQSRALVHDLAVQGHRVGMVCLENFAEAARLLPEIAHVAPLPGSALLRALTEAPKDLPRQWPLAAAALDSWQRELIAAFPYEDVRNLTATTSARLLCRLLCRPQLGNCPSSGFGLDDEGFGTSGNPWGAFTLGSTLARGNSPFNIVDLFRRMGQDAATVRGLRTPGAVALTSPSEENRHAALELLQAEAPQGTAGFVGLQLGASNDARRLPTATFAALGDLLWEHHRLCPVLLGHKSELPLVERYRAKAERPFISLCGRTGLGELAAALTHLRLLVSNDTGTLHLAAGLGVPVLGVYLATAQPFDTGPYRENSCTVEPDMPCHPCPFGRPCPHGHACRAHISAQTLFERADAFLRTGTWPTGPAVGARVWLSEFDDHGFMDLRSLSGHEHEDRTLWMELQRPLLRQFIDDEPELPSVPQVTPVTLSPEGRSLFGKELNEAVMLSELMAGQAELLLMRPLPAVRDKLLKTIRLMGGLLDEHPRLAALKILFFQYTEIRDPLALPVPLKNFHTLLKALRDSIVRD